MKKLFYIVSIVSSVLISCKTKTSPVSDSKTVHLVTLDPGHFHAALVQKTMYDDVDSVVYVYGPPGPDIDLHLGRIKNYNERADHPTHWKEFSYHADDFFMKMLEEKRGNVVVISGNNERKANYILESLQDSLNVLADKPMAIDEKGFEEIKQAFDVAKKNNLLLYDIMTERFEITTILQRELSMIPEIFGILEKGTAKDPAVVKESTHYFYKYVSGNVLTRPAWFFDVSQQGEGIADVMTHLVDLVQWECFPEQAIDYTKDIEVNSAKHWTTDLSLDEFKTLTQVNTVPEYLKKNLTNDTLLKIFSNGEINYTIRGVHAKTTTQWNYKSENNTGDLYYSLMRGSKVNLVIRQAPEEKYQPTLYIEPVKPTKAFDINEQFKKIQAKYPGVELKQSKKGWQVIIPEKYKEGHEEHFARVTQNFLEYLKNPPAGRQGKNMPAWEVPGMLAKYYVTTKAVELANKK